MKMPIHNYRLVAKQPDNSEKNEIRVKANARPFIYAAYAGKLLFEKKFDKVFMLATGSATAKVIQSVEYVRKRIKGLCTCYEIESTEFTDEYEPLLEGLDPVKVKRLVPTLKAHLFLNKDDNLKSQPGFMPPLPDSQLLDQEKFRVEVEDHFKKERRVSDDNEEGRHGDKDGNAAITHSMGLRRRARGCREADRGYHEPPRTGMRSKRGNREAVPMLWSSRLWSSGLSFAI